MAKSERPGEAVIDGERYRRIEILLLTREHCGFCEQASDILERLSHDYWLQVTTCDLQTPEGQRLALQAGVLFPPGLFIEGQAFSYGRLSERKLRRELDRRLGCAERPSAESRRGRHKDGGRQTGDPQTTPMHRRPPGRHQEDA